MSFERMTCTLIQISLFLFSHQCQGDFHFICGVPLICFYKCYDFHVLFIGLDRYLHMDQLRSEKETFGRR